MKVTPWMIHLALILTLFYSRVVMAEFECSTEVSYSWVPRMVEDKKGEKSKKGELKRTTVEVVRATGESEDDAKSAVQRKCERAVDGARKICQRVHEDVSGCIAGKHASSAATLKQLSFSARRELEQSILEDCNALAGLCQKTEASDPVCIERKKEEPTAEEAGKDDKKKK